MPAVDPQTRDDWQCAVDAAHGRGRDLIARATTIAECDARTVTLVCRACRKRVKATFTPPDIWEPARCPHCFKALKIDGRTGAKHDRTCLPIGTVRIRSKGRGRNGKPQRVRMVKIDHRGRGAERWMYYSRWWWLHHKGEIPEGKRVFHVDGNVLNDDPENYALGDCNDAAAIWHAENPAESEKHFARLREATAEHNRLRAAINRIQRWLPSQWYPVDHERRIIYNMPRRKRWQVYEAFGLKLQEVGWRRVRSASLGWRDLLTLDACILACLAGGPMHSDELREAVRELRGRHGWSQEWCRGTWFTAMSRLGARKYVISVRRGCKGGRYLITPAAIEARTAAIPVAPALGSQFGDEPFCSYEKVNEGGERLKRTRRGDAVVALREVIAEDRSSDGMACCTSARDSHGHGWRRCVDGLPEPVGDRSPRIHSGATRKRRS